VAGWAGGVAAGYRVAVADDVAHLPDEQICDLANRRVEQADADAVGSDRDRLDVSNFPRHCPSAAASMCRRSTCLRRGREDASWTYPTAEQRYGENGEIRGDRGEYAKIEGDTGI
jgi:hypothetical protein